MIDFVHVTVFHVQSSSSYGYYGGPPYKRQRRLSDDDVGPPAASYGPAFYDPPYARHQVGQYLFIVSTY